MEDFGKLVPSNQPEQLAKAVLEFSNIDFSSRRLELRGKIEEKFSWDKNVDALIGIYEELI